MPMFPKLILVISSVSGMLAVMLGAFGAHALKARLDPRALAVWDTAVQYHFIHTLALLFTAVLMQNLRHGALSASAWLFLGGIVLFSGSLYWLALGGPRWLGPMTPIGGVFFIAGWASLAIYALRQ